MEISQWLWGLIPDTVGLLAVYMLSKQKRIGWLIMLTNLLIIWTAFAITYQIWGFFPGIIAHSYIAIQGWNRWKP